MRRRVAAVVSVFVVVTALICGIFGALAVDSLTRSGGTDGEVVTAGGRDGIGGGAPGAKSAVTVPPHAGPAAPVVQPVTQVTPERNPPLMAEGSEGERVRELQVRLAHLGLFDADVTGYFGNVTAGGVRAYQESTGQAASGEIYPDLWASLQAETPQPTQEQLYPPPPVAEPPTVPAGSLDARCLTGKVICADKTERVVRWVVNGRILLEMDARFGRDSLPTTDGVFSVFWKSRDHVSSIYEADMPFALFFNGGQAVHYSPEFSSIGYSGVGSHGCVNTRDYDGMEWLFDQVQTGDKVVVYWS